MREAYRHKVEIYRRLSGGGGYAEEQYKKIGETSCEVRDESQSEYAAAESARLGHVCRFRMRTRTILQDDMLLFNGKSYLVKRVDQYKFGGREIVVIASRSESKYSILGENTHGTA